MSNRARRIIEMVKCASSTSTTDCETDCQFVSIYSSLFMKKCEVAIFQLLLFLILKTAVILETCDVSISV